MLPASISRFASSNAFSRHEAIEFDRNHIQRLVLARHFDLTAIGFGNYRSPRPIGSLKGGMVNPLKSPSFGTRAQSVVGKPRTVAALASLGCTVRNVCVQGMRP